MSRRIPEMTTDKEAEAFLDQDLSDLDMARFQPVNWEMQSKSARITMRVPQGLVDALKAKAEARGVPYQRLIREAIEKVI